MTELMPLPLNVSCFTKIQVGFTFWVPAHLGSPDKGRSNACAAAYGNSFHLQEKPTTNRQTHYWYQKLHCPIWIHNSRAQKDSLQLCEVDLLMEDKTRR